MERPGQPSTRLSCTTVLTYIAAYSASPLTLHPPLSNLLSLPLDYLLFAHNFQIFTSSSDFSDLRLIYSYFHAPSPCLVGTADNDSHLQRPPPKSCPGTPDPIWKLTAYPGLQPKSDCPWGGTKAQLQRAPAVGLLLTHPSFLFPFTLPALLSYSLAGLSLP